MLPTSASVWSQSLGVTITLLVALVVLPAWAAETIVLDGSTGETSPTHPGRLCGITPTHSR